MQRHLHVHREETNRVQAVGDGARVPQRQRVCGVVFPLLC